MHQTLRAARRAAVLATLVCGAFTATTAFAQSVVIGDFETPALDAWGTAGGPGNPVLSQGSLGVTLNNFSLKSANPQGAFWGPATGNLLPVHRDTFINTQTLQFDITYLSSELNGGSGSFDGFAQSNEIAVTMFAPDGPDPDPDPDLNIFAQRGAFGALTEVHSLPAHPLGQWGGVDGTRTYVWNLQAVTAVDPADGLTKPVGQILANHPDIVEVKIALVQQTGNATAPVGDANFYFDNVRLNIPEPTTLALSGLLLPALALRQRRRAR